MQRIQFNDANVFCIKIRSYFYSVMLLNDKYMFSKFFFDIKYHNIN